MKILHIIGTRPQIIKLASVLNYKDSFFEHSIIDTNQHYEDSMQKNLYRDFGIDLSTIKFLDSNKLLSSDISSMFSLLSQELNQIKPDIVFIYGDTNTTVAGALSAKLNNIPSVHIEAGLRSYLQMQIEETNRIIADELCDYLFCPTETAVSNLKKEKLDHKAFLVGDITLDIFLNTKPKKPSLINSDFLNHQYYLSTIHRKENLNNHSKLENILNSLSTLPRVILPLHHSLKTKLIEINLYERVSNSIELIDPLLYSEILFLIKHSSGVITDSGGLQKDAFWLELPVLTIRENTEWRETVDCGQNLLVNEFPVNLIDKFNSINITDINRHSLFGNGNAVLNIMNTVKEIFV